MLRSTVEGKAYLEEHGLLPLMPAANHIAWTTGGLFVPEVEYRRFLERGASLDTHLAG
jgi:D-serine dehydratase